MLLKYSFKNFCSFKDEVSFSMKPGKVMDRFQDNVVNISPRLKILKSAVVVGENGGGKTSFMRSLHFFKYLFEENRFPRMLKDLSFNINPDDFQEYKLTIFENNTIYTYELTIDQYSVVSEKLYTRSINQPEKLDKEVFCVERIEINKVHEDIALKQISLKIEYGVKVEKQIIDEDLIAIAKENWDYKAKGLFLNYLALLGVDIIVPLINWIQDKLIVELPKDHSLNVYKKMKKDEEDIPIMKTDSFFEIFTLVDSTIVAIEVNEEDPFEKTIIVRKINNADRFAIELKNESSGIREYFAWAIQLWKVIYQNKILFADEIDRVLNSILADRIVSLIQGTEHTGQFIFSTHNVLHLNTRSFMKEQLYFVTKKVGDLSSEMYSLADFKDYRYEKSDVYELYLKGILGGVPNA